ncbi:DUF4468 domain-containing protein [Bacteroides sp.]|uniref:DUF4468 domain-containing protein n=1 Tax=Bacteroides sp. TaxID=29523 RepID=UPI001B592512|nr:DUF4468 domain-containing protein [Bacteroides sp.]MBP6064455.1 DUF4468 domain-containing protein [Bacteroides sp.]MBP6067208.1 DUF4468 domain-containing protein [Bacteroides sp.]MBP6936255.1 DUF4468 domain-containing protein [Bacteroides sp.]MBP8621158.1 DUF4468 domain-containing protein [Bacteroides sp.]MBP9586984.1 DUF4468 domain-containing protein [Bacteroides sp.]
MNRLTHSFLVLLLACIPIGMMAQDNDDNDDSRYLVGAVPEVNGKVVFSKEFSIPGMSQQQLFEHMQKWLAERLKANNNIDSRVVYTDIEKGMIAGVGEEWLVFKSSALSLDRTLLNYQVTISCQPAKCLMEIEKIRYTYREKEKYSAEEWITDKYALNKTQTKLVRGLAKWRKKTVDFADELFDQATLALSTSGSQPKAEKASKKAAVTSGPVVINTTPMTVIEPATPITSTATPLPSSSTSDLSGYRSIAPDQVPANAIQMGSGKLVIAIGKDAFNMTMMTANAGGSLGKVSGKPVVFSILSPDQAYDSLEKAESYTVRFYPTNQTEPSVILECKRLPAPTPMEGQPRTYAGEIVKAWMK